MEVDTITGDKIKRSLAGLLSGDRVHAFRLIGNTRLLEVSARCVRDQPEDHQSVSPNLSCKKQTEFDRQCSTMQHEQWDDCPIAGPSFLNNVITYLGQIQEGN